MGPSSGELLDITHNNKLIICYIWWFYRSNTCAKGFKICTWFWCKIVQKIRKCMLQYLQIATDGHCNCSANLDRAVWFDQICYRFPLSLGGMANDNFKRNNWPVWVEWLAMVSKGIINQCDQLLYTFDLSMRQWTIHSWALLISAWRNHISSKHKFSISYFCISHTCDNLIVLLFAVHCLTLFQNQKASPQYRETATQGNVEIEEM